VKRHSASKNSYNTNGHNGFINLSIMREQGCLDETSRYNLRAIAKSKQEMNRLINVLLNLSCVDEA
jgi:hypothetical protein